MSEDATDAGRHEAESGRSEPDRMAGAEPAGAELATLVALQAKLVQAELRTAAARAGMIDLDGVKLVDASQLKLNADAVLESAGAIMSKLRQDKPWLFSRNSSSPATVPRAEPAKPKTAMEMTTEEWRVARAELLRRK